VLALDLLRRQLVAGAAGAAVFAARDRTAGAAPPAGGGRPPGGAPPPAPGEKGAQPVVVVGWRAGTINVNVAGKAAAAQGQDAARSYEDAMRRGAGREYRADDLMRRAAPDRAGGRQREAAGGGGRRGPGGAVAALVGTFGRVLGPLMAISTVLGQANSGMSAFSKAVNILGATLAPILLPGIVLLSAAILSVSDIIWSKLRPNLAAWTTFVMQTLIPAVEGVVSSLADFADAIKWVIDVAKNPSKLVTGTKPGATGPSAGGVAETADRISRLTDPLGVNRGILGAISGSTAGSILFPGLSLLGRAAGAGRTRTGASSDALGPGGGDRDIRALGPPTGERDIRPLTAPQTPGDLMRERVAGSRAARESPAPAPAGTPGQPPRRSVGDNVRLIARDLAMALGPQASMGSITGATKSATLASLNKSPLDAELLMRNLESIQELLRGIDGNTERQPTPRYGIQRPEGG
jgi:hypothetical protein